MRQVFIGKFRGRTTVAEGVPVKGMGGAFHIEGRARSRPVEVEPLPGPRTTARLGAPPLPAPPHMSNATAAAAIKRIRLGAGALRGQKVAPVAAPSPTPLLAAPKAAAKVIPDI